MTKKRIAIVDQRRDLRDFLKENLEMRGYSVFACFSEAEAELLNPLPDVTLVDFEEFGVDLDGVAAMIEEELVAAGR